MTEDGLRFVGGCVLAIVSVVPVIAGQQPSAPASRAAVPSTESSDYRIGPEDVLDILVWKNADLTRTVQVRPDGMVSLPLVNDVQAQGLAPMQLRDVLAKGYAKFFTDPEVLVNVREIHSVKISVLGMVKTPGRYEVNSRMTILEALAMAGGFTDFAKRDKVFVSRQVGAASKRIPFNYLKMLAGDDGQNILLLGGDIVIVP
jgi:polysaccharide export outer membrane protein